MTPCLPLVVKAGERLGGVRSELHNRLLPVPGSVTYCLSEFGERLVVPPFCIAPSVQRRAWQRQEVRRANQRFTPAKQILK